MCLLRYLDQIEAVVSTLGRARVYTIIDAHQDCLGRRFCGEGVPDWAVLKAVSLAAVNATDPREAFPSPYRWDLDVGVSAPASLPQVRKCLGQLLHRVLGGADGAALAQTHVAGRTSSGVSHTASSTTTAPSSLWLRGARCTPGVSYGKTSRSIGTPWLDASQTTPPSWATSCSSERSKHSLFSS
jgi:hypothetical protein|eukprot:COSAG01_NODE_767_length_13740_cov_525.281651_10_plen_185_part_00